MKAIDLYYQAEGVPEIQHLEAAPDETFGAVKARLRDKHNLADDTQMFVEDDEDPTADNVLIRDRAGPKGVKLHLSRCRHVAVTVTFNNKTVERRFAPATTVARVKSWAAEHEFGMTKEEAGEHVLQIAGTHERPAPNTHLGTLTRPKTCSVQFDLVPDERVNGASKWGDL